MGDAIDDLIEEILLDAHGENEQLWSFLEAFEQDVQSHLQVVEQEE